MWGPTTNEIRYDACLPVNDDFAGQGDVPVQTIVGGDYAVMTHCGPYESLAETYSALIKEYAPEQGREAADGPCFEVYRNNPQNTAPKDLRTDVHVPLR
jgi:AraC family transcriptional regulator